MFSWINTVNWLNMIIAGLVIGVGVLVSYIVRKLVYRVTIHVMPPNIAYNIARITYFVLVILFTISGLSLLGINLTGLVVAGGLLGIILVRTTECYSKPGFRNIPILGETFKARRYNEDR